MAKDKETQFGVVRLSDDDRALLRAVTTAVAALKGKPGKGAAAEAEDTGDGDGESGDGESGDGESGDGDGESGDGDDFETGDAEGETDAKPTRDDVRAALAAYANAPGKSKAGAIKLMEKIGGSNALSKLKEAKFAAVIEAAKKAAAKK